MHGSGNLRGSSAAGSIRQSHLTVDHGLLLLLLLFESGDARGDLLVRWNQLNLRDAQTLASFLGLVLYQVVLEIQRMIGVQRFASIQEKVIVVETDVRVQCGFNLRHVLREVLPRNQPEKATSLEPTPQGG